MVYFFHVTYRKLPNVLCTTFRQLAHFIVSPFLTNPERFINYINNSQRVVTMKNYLCLDVFKIYNLHCPAHISIFSGRQIGKYGVWHVYIQEMFVFPWCSFSFFFIWCVMASRANVTYEQHIINCPTHVSRRSTLRDINLAKRDSLFFPSSSPLFFRASTPPYSIYSTTLN